MGLVAPRHVGSSRTRAQTRVPYISRWILNHCATREAPPENLDKNHDWTLPSACYKPGLLNHLPDSAVNRCVQGKRKQRLTGHWPEGGHPSSTNRQPCRSVCPGARGPVMRQHVQGHQCYPWEKQAAFCTRFRSSKEAGLHSV